jgi:hypothetical protein
VAGALPFEESGAVRGLDSGFHIVLVVGLLLIHCPRERQTRLLVERL